jgi:hypothetical protein
LTLAALDDWMVEIILFIRLRRYFIDLAWTLMVLSIK